MKRSRLFRSDRLPYQLTITVFLTLNIVFVLLPIYITVLNSVKNDFEIMSGIFSIPSKPVWSTYATAFQITYRHILNSILLAFVGAFANMVLAAVISYIFARKEFFLKEFFFFIYITILLVPSIMGMPVLYEFIYKIRLLDSYFAVWLPVVAGGQAGALFLFRTFFSQQPSSLFDAAKIDGASDPVIFLRIVVPLALPILLLNFIGTFVAQYNDFLWPSLVLKSAEKLPLMPIIQRLSDTFTSRNMATPYAMYVIASIPLAVTTVLSLRHFQDGDFASGMKL